MREDNLYPVSTEHLTEAPVEQQTATEIEQRAVTHDYPIMKQTIEHLEDLIANYGSVMAIDVSDRGDTHRFMVAVDANSRLVTELTGIKGWMEALIAEHIK